MLVLHYPMLADDAEELSDDIEFLQELETLAHDELRKAGLGECDGTDIGNGNMNVFCTVRDADARAACAVLVAALDREGIDGAVIAFFEDAREDADAVVLYPEGFAGTFNVMTGCSDATKSRRADAALSQCCDAYASAVRDGFVREAGAERWLADLEKGSPGAAGYGRTYGPRIHFCPFCGHGLGSV